MITKLIILPCDGANIAGEALTRTFDCAQSFPFDLYNSISNYASCE
jgi:hypothetical protein